MLHRQKSRKSFSTKHFGRHAEVPAKLSQDYTARVIICSNCKGNGYKFAVLDLSDFTKSKITTCESCQGAGEYKNQIN